MQDKKYLKIKQRIFVLLLIKQRSFEGGKGTPGMSTVGGVHDNFGWSKPKLCCYSKC